MKIKGVIFDLDGTILDSAWVWEGIDRDFLGRRGIDVPPDYAKKIISMSFEDVARYTIERFSLDETIRDVMAEWDAMAKEAYAHEVVLKEGTRELLAWLADHKILVGIATSNSAGLFAPCLENNGILEYFHSHTETGDVARGKEFPDVYIKEAEKLGCRPEECVVFEDIIPALRGAAAGGFVTAAVEEDKWKYDKNELKDSCDLVIRDLREAIGFLADRI